MNHGFSIRPSAAAILVVVGLVAVLLVAGTEQAMARRQSHSGGGEPGEFAYYLLSLSWSPAFCLSQPGAAECGGPRRYGFIVHGLWPQNEQGWPEHCNVRTQVPDDVVNGISDLMPARALVYHEWSTHGTCSGLQPAAFFALLRRAYTSVSIPPPMAAPTRTIEQSPEDVTAAFLQANKRLPAQSVVVTCSGQGAPRLREVHICLDRGLSPRACSPEVLRAGCRAPQLLIPPVR